MNRNPMTYPKQTGIVLPVVLIMVAVLTLISAAGMKNRLFEERMAGSMKRFADTQQAADYMLGLCERTVVSGVLPNGSPMPVSKYLPQGPIPVGTGPLTAGVAWWAAPTAWQPGQGLTVFSSDTQAQVPHFEMNCLAEVLVLPPDATSQFVGDVPAFRLTAFARRIGSGSDVMVQATVRY